MKNLKTKCIILGKKNYGETDKLVFLYSEEFGKIKAIAKGARKITSKFTGHLETLNSCIVELYNGPKNIILQEIITENTPFRSRKSLSAISSAINIAEITNKSLFENQILENLPALINETLKLLLSSQKKTLITISYLIKFFDLMGVVPDFSKLFGTHDLAGNKKFAEEKYQKFFNFVKTKPLKDILKINLTKEEKNKIVNFTQNMIFKEIDKPVKLSLF